MKRRSFLAVGLMAPLLPACASTDPQASPIAADPEKAPGSNRDFSFTVATENPDQVWELWTTPATWGQWDRGLKSAEMDGPMALGSVGRIEPLSGPSSSFTVVAFDPKQAYAFETPLPGAALRVERSFNADRTAFTHRVRFTGLMAFFFASSFGPGFRRALPPTMRTLEALAAEQAP